VNRVDSEFQEDWEQLTSQARDGRLFGGGYDQSLLRLIDASRDTGLRRFHPFTSMNRLCFARSSWPFQDIQPALVEFLRDGKYIVRSEGPYPPDRDGPIALETADAAAAVSSLIRLLHV